MKKRITIISILAFSFILEGVFSNYISASSFFSPLFVLMSIIIIYPFFINDKKNYYKYCFITGVLYDVIYMDTIIVHGFLFLIICYLLTKINLILANNHINIMIIAVIIIIIYRVILYSLLILTGNINFDIFNLLKSIYLSLISNVLYVLILNIITDRLSTKLKLYKGN